MLYNTLKVESKNNDWKVVDVAGVDGTVLEGASVNRTDKKTGAPFPHFDEIVEGFQFEANPWTNQAGKHYLFPPRAKKEAGNQAISRAMEKKVEGIREAQERKDESIKVSSTARDATLLVVAAMEAGSVKPEDWRVAWTEVRRWLWQEFDNTSKYSEPPF